MRINVGKNLSQTVDIQLLLLATYELYCLGKQLSEGRVKHYLNIRNDLFANKLYARIDELMSTV